MMGIEIYSYHLSLFLHGSYIVHILYTSRIDPVRSSLLGWEQSTPELQNLLAALGAGPWCIEQHQNDTGDQAQAEERSGASSLALVPGDLGLHRVARIF